MLIRFQLRVVIHEHPSCCCTTKARADAEAGIQSSSAKELFRIFSMIQSSSMRRVTVRVLNIYRHWLCLIAVCTAPISKCTLFNLFFLVPSGLDCAPANSFLLWIWCAHVHRLFFALLVPVAAKVQCQTSTSVVLCSPNADHRNLCPIVSMSFYLCRLEVPGLHMAASITSACLGHDNS